MYEQIPSELKSLVQWVCWQAQPDETRPGKMKKIPINAKTGGQAQSNNEETWCDYDTAVKVSKKYSGIGFMLANGYFGIDLDDCEGAIEDYKIGDTGNIVAEFIYTLGSYAEYSQSGKGIHIICRGTLPPAGRRKGTVEMYELGRFFVMTGNSASEYAEITEGTEKVKILHEKYIGGGTTPSTGISIPLPLNLSEAEIIKACREFKARRCVQAFIQWETGKLFIRHSRKQTWPFAICLPFGLDAMSSLMDRMFRSSGLMRPKWDRKQAGSHYGVITIKKGNTRLQ